MKYITVALAKGRLAKTAVSMFEKMGFDVAEMMEKSRKLIFTDEKTKMKFILVKASDVPVYVEYGAADIGIVGRDTILEEDRYLYETLDMGFGACRMAVAGFEQMKDRIYTASNLKVATKYPRIAKEFFHGKKGQTIEIIPLSGSVELAPLVGLSDVIVDIVESGDTLRENGLCVLDEICGLSAWLIVNRVSMKMERQRIMQVVQGLKELTSDHSK